MKHYTDADVIAVLRKHVAASSYKRAAEALKVDVGQLYRSIQRTIPLAPKIAASVGFVPVAQERAWTRKAHRGQP